MGKLYMVNKYTVADSTGMNVVILISNGKDGCGWSTWNHDECVKEQMLFDAGLVKAVLDGDATLVAEIAKEKYGNYGIFIDAALTLVVEWIPKGTKFSIGEHAGKEWIIYRDYTA